MYRTMFLKECDPPPPPTSSTILFMSAASTSLYWLRDLHVWGNPSSCIDPAYAEITTSEI